MIRLVWRAEDDRDGCFTDPANEYWGIAFTRRPGSDAVATIIGPSVQAREMDYRAGDAHWGVDFEVHVAWRGLDKGPLLGRLVDVPIEDGWCEIAGIRICVPGYDGLEEFVQQLAGQGVLVADHDVYQALCGDDPHWSQRTMRRRFRETTGLGRKQIDQVRRAREAYALLQQGMRPAEVAVQVGYADQPHLTRALRLLAGQTPAAILAGLG